MARNVFRLVSYVLLANLLLFILFFASFFIHFHFDFHVRRPISDICKQFDKLAGLLPCNIYVHKIVKAIEKIINPKKVKTNENKTKRVGGGGNGNDDELCIYKS